MSSRAAELERSTASGDALEAEIVQTVDALSTRAVTFEVESEIIVDTE
ncbi:hypothetical protein [Natrinema soli]|uniref:Uncharacterized protein n=1 Tax=Natrinema soli TaxID=1930624 RepID=A0ABD5SNE1_9EURY|nr:hypothetical protein [Natrinema soli]